MKRAPKSLNASVGPWNSSRTCSRSLSVTSGTGKLNASVTIFIRMCVGISSPANNAPTSCAISWNVSDGRLFQEILVQERNFDGHIQPAVGRRSAKNGVAQGNFRAAVESASVFHHAGRACPSSNSRKPRASRLSVPQAFHGNDAVRVAFVKFFSAARSVEDSIARSPRARIRRGAEQIDRPTGRASDRTNTARSRVPLPREKPRGTPPW